MSKYKNIALLSDQVLLSEHPDPRYGKYHVMGVCESCEAEKKYRIVIKRNMSNKEKVATLFHEIAELILQWNEEKGRDKEKDICDAAAQVMIVALAKYPAALAGVMEFISEEISSRGGNTKKKKK